MSLWKKDEFGVVCVNDIRKEIRYATEKLRCGCEHDKSCSRGHWVKDGQFLFEENGHKYDIIRFTCLFCRNTKEMKFNVDECFTKYGGILKDMGIDPQQKIG